MIFFQKPNIIDTIFLKNSTALVETLEWAFLATRRTYYGNVPTPTAQMKAGRIEWQFIKTFLSPVVT